MNTRQNRNPRLFSEWTNRIIIICVLYFAGELYD
jgi:hypothetical protein